MRSYSFGGKGDVTFSCLSAGSLDFGLLPAPVTHLHSPTTPGCTAARRARRLARGTYTGVPRADTSLSRAFLIVSQRGR